MKKLVVLLALIGVLAVVVAPSATPTPVNWKTQLARDCRRELVNANWTRIAVLNHQDRLAYNRAQRLHRTIRACRTAIADMP